MFGRHSSHKGKPMADESPKIPDGMVQMWDPKEKKVILVSAPPKGPDVLHLTVRLHDPRERENAKKSAWWGTVKIPRTDVSLASAEFASKHITPLIEDIQKAISGK